MWSRTEQGYEISNIHVSLNNKDWYTAIRFHSKNEINYVKCFYALVPKDYLRKVKHLIISPGSSTTPSFLIDFRITEFLEFVVTRCRGNKNSGHSCIVKPCGDEQWVSVEKSRGLLKEYDYLELLAEATGYIINE